MARPKYEHGAMTAKERMVEAFWSLLEKLSYDRISVLEIVGTANVNKNTFYYHYEDMDGIAKEAAEDILVPDVFWGFLQNVGTYAVDAEQDSEAEGNPAEQYEDLDIRFRKLCLLAGDHTTPWLRSMLKDAILRSWIDRFSIDRAALDEDGKLLLEFTLGGILEIMAYCSRADAALAFTRIVAIGNQMGLADRLRALE